MKHQFENMRSFEPQIEDQAFVFERLLAVARRQWRVIALCTAVSGVIGGAYAFAAVPKYISSASIQIDSGNRKIADQLSSLGSDVSDDAAIANQIEVLKSEKLGLKVAQRLNLKENHLFLSQRSSTIGQMASWLIERLKSPRSFSAKTEIDSDPHQINESVLKLLSDNFTVSKVPGSHTLVLAVESTSAKLSADLAQAYAEEYLSYQLDTKNQANRQAGDWLQQRMRDLRQQALDSDSAVQRFRQEKGLIASDGKLVTDQQLTQINSQLVIARAAATDSQVRYERIANIVNSKDMDAAVSESLSSSVVTDLRSKYLEASRKRSDIVARFGANHAQAVRLTTEMDGYSRVMFEELQRIAQSYENDFRIADANRTSLQQQLDQATAVSGNANVSQVQLRELERESETYRRLYEAFLQRYQESVQQETFTVSEANIISDARTPTGPSSPKTNLIIALSLFLGCLTGSTIGGLREARDRFFRNGDEIRTILDQDFLGSIPLERDDAKSKSIAHFAFNYPASAFVETLRSAKIKIDMLLLQKPRKVIGITSSLPGEGKSTIAVNLAELLASVGARVLLIDADLRNPGATRILGAQGKFGILEALANGRLVPEAMGSCSETNLTFLPALVQQRVAHSSEILVSPAMDRLLQNVAESFDYVIIDLPPVVPVVDARAIAPKIDTYLFVVEWGETAQSMVKKAFLENPTIAKKCAGVILNKVDADRMKLYTTHGSADYYSSRYTNYYSN
jgi:succinoglycan biosynthesis transport protein ExoP